MAFSTHTDLEKLIVLGVMAVGDGDIDIHEIGVVDYDSKKGHAPVFRKVPIKFRLEQDLSDFCDGGGREGESTGTRGGVEGLTGDQLGKKECADQGVCVEDNAQVTPQ